LRFIEFLIFLQNLIESVKLNVLVKFVMGPSS